MNLIINILKFSSIVLVIVLAFHFSYAYFNDNKSWNTNSMIEVDNFSNSTNNNKHNFKKSNTIILANVWVALSTNIWIKHKQRQVQNLYKDLPKLSKYISKKERSDNRNLTRHLIKISEYYNVLKTDVRQLLDTSYNRASVLESYIDQLKYRYKWTIIEMHSLLKKKAQLSKDLKSSQIEIKNIKIKIDKDFKNFNSVETEKNIENFLNAKAKYNYNYTYIIFINQYLNQYKHLNNANKKLLDTLINNKEALVRNTHIVIPSTGIKNLKKLNLIINEK